MDKSIVSPKSGREKWLSFERVADFVLLDMPPTCTLLDARTRVALLAEDETLRCRSPGIKWSQLRPSVQMVATWES